MARHIRFVYLIPFIITPLNAFELNTAQYNQTHTTYALISHYVNSVCLEQLTQLLSHDPAADALINSDHLARAIYWRLYAQQHYPHAEWIATTHEMIMTLIEHGANPHHVTSRGITALAFAREGNFDEVTGYQLHGNPKLAQEIESLWAARQ